MNFLVLQVGFSGWVLFLVFEEVWRCIELRTLFSESIVFILTATEHAMV